MNCQRSFKSEPFRSGDFRLLEKRKWHVTGQLKENTGIHGALWNILNREVNQNDTGVFTFSWRLTKQMQPCAFYYLHELLKPIKKLWYCQFRLAPTCSDCPKTETCQFDDKPPNSQPTHSFNRLNSFGRRKSNQMDLHIDYVEGKIA